MKYDHNSDWYAVEDKVPKRSHDWVSLLSDLGLLDIMEVTDGSYRIAFKGEKDFNLGSDEIDLFRKLLGCDSVNCYNNTSDGLAMIDCDYKKDIYGEILDK